MTWKEHADESGKAPEHKKAALKAHSKGAINEPITTENKVKWMYEQDQKYDLPQKTGGIHVFHCPKCGTKSKVFIDSHDDYVCDCGYEMTLGVHDRHLSETDFDKLLEECNFDKDVFDAEVNRIAAFLEKTNSPTYGQGRFWSRYNEWNRLSDDESNSSKLKKMEIMRRGDDLYCRDAKTHEFLGILRHSLGFYGESTGIFMRMETTSLNELGYEEVPGGYFPEGAYYVHKNGKWQMVEPHRMDVREQF